MAVLHPCACACMGVNSDRVSARAQPAVGNARPQCELQGDRRSALGPACASQCRNGVQMRTNAHVTAKVRPLHTYLCMQSDSLRRFTIVVLYYLLGTLSMESARDDADDVRVDADTYCSVCGRSHASGYSVLSTQYSALSNHPSAPTQEPGDGGWVLALKLDLSLPSGCSLELCTNNSQM